MIKANNANFDIEKVSEAFCDAINQGDANLAFNIFQELRAVGAHIKFYSAPKTMSSQEKKQSQIVQTLKKKGFSQKTVDQVMQNYEGQDIEELIEECSQIELQNE